MVCETTLKVKNLPMELTDVEKEDFMKHFGAVQVKIITSKSKEKSTVFAKFESKETAKSVMLRLHQLYVLNSYLSVEFAPNDIVQSHPTPKSVENAYLDHRKHYRMFLSKLMAWNSAVNFFQPPPPHLRYVYPRPNRATINNIGHALATVPKFYTQVLHLMNRMNLPPPFSDIPDPPKMSLRQIPPVKEIPKSESSESEIESDPESNKTENVTPVKRKATQKKTVKRPKFIKPNVVQPNVEAKGADKTEEVFEKVDLNIQRKIEVKVAADSLEQKNVQREDKHLKVGRICIQEEERNFIKTVKEAKEVASEETKVISEEELSSNRIPLKDLSVLPVFKNYHPGAPSCRLYIKNIAKSVEIKDLEFIYKRYQLETLNELTPSQFDVRLMQEGRMKGQAFITFDSIQLAQQALKETNGFILRDKPLVVVYARSAPPKK